jgi:phosphocarrier protein
MNVITKEFIIENECGLHARPSASFVKKAMKFESQIQVSTNEETVDGKSILGLLCLSAEKGTKLKITASGRDAETAVKEIGSLIQNRFGESY